MQLSKFNILSNYNNKLLAFNSLNGNFLCTDINSNVALFLKGIENNLSQEEQNYLILKGFAVEQTKTEDIKAQKKLFDYMYDNSLELVIMPTMQCNFRCSYCYEDFKIGMISEQSINSILKYLRNNLSKHSGLSINWFGGEPLLAIEQIEQISSQAIEICSYLKIPYSSCIITNGYLLTPNNIHKLLKMRVYEIQITIDGTEEFHDKNRTLAGGGGTFQKIINNLLYIRDNIKSSTLQILIRCNLSKSSLKSIPEFINELNEWFGEDKRFKFYFHPIENWGGSRVNKLNNDLLQGAELFFNVLSNEQLKIHIEHSFKKLQFSPMCNSIKINHFAIDPELKVYKCTLHKGDSYSCIGRLLDGYMDIDKNKLAKWSFNTIEEYKTCINECSAFANCFARLCPYKMNGDNAFQCSSKSKKISKMMEIDYKFNPSKYVIM